MPEEQLALPIPGMDNGNLPPIDDDGEEEESTEIECSTCGYCVEREDASDIDGELHCRDCVHSCERCDYITTNDDELHSAHTTSYVSSRSRGDTECCCGDCCWQCANCTRHFSSSVAPSYQNYDNQDICERCAEDYSTCEDCSDVVRNEYSHYHDTREVTLCQSCFRESEAKTELVHEYGYKPDPAFQLAPNQSRRSSHLYLGWELECDRQRASDDVDTDIIESGIDSNVVYCKEDSSLNHGFEMVSHPGTWEYWEQFDWMFAPALAKRGYRSYDTTTAGMHVHVSKEWLSDRDRYKLLLFFRSNHELVFRLSRRASLAKMNAYAAIDHDRKAALLRKAKKSNDTERYRAINLRPKHTVEFRLFRGTLNPQSIKRNLALVTMICHFAKDTSPGRISDNDFLTYVLAHGARIIGEPMATDLGNWVSEAVNGPCAADTGH